MSGFAPPSSRSATSRFVVFGLALVLLGWIALVADLTLADTLLKSGSLVAVLSLKGDIVTIAQTLVVTGFGFALVGALRDGFGALSRFFDAVLQRSTAPRPAAPAPERTAVPDEVVVTVPVTDRMVSPAPHRDRNYVILPDGSVEVETLLGTRIFATMDEARAFIR